MSEVMKNPSDITAVILAGGLGTRLRKVVSDRPKVLSDVCERPFLSYLFDQLINGGFKHVVLCIGYMGEQVRKVFGSRYGSLRLSYSQEAKPLGTAGAIRNALPLFKSKSLLILNGDSFFETDLRSFLNQHNEKCSNASLLLVEMTDTRHYGSVNVDTNCMVKSYDEKASNSRNGWVNSGIYLIEEHMIQTIPAHKSVSMEHEMFPVWIGHGLYGYQRHGRFIDIGTPETFAKAQEFFACHVQR
jgi:D-glycero-alpha-D-manno-heptose 1-phosphate guanylyltransferase